ncbi:MAG: biopolymer transporter ExbD [Pseudomonadota bacterium]
MDERYIHSWRARLKRRRGKAFKPIQIRELNLVAMMDMLTIILVFLLKSYSVSALSMPVGGEIHIPKSSGITAPQEAVKLTVMRAVGGEPGVIAVDELKVIRLDAGKEEELRAQSQRRDFLIKDLHKALVKKADGIKEIERLNKSITFEGKILVIADKDTPYWLITEVLYTAAEAQFDKYSLVALREHE